MILRKTPARIINKIEKKVESSIDAIIQRGEKNSWRNLPAREIEFVRGKIAEIIAAYPPKMRPVVATIMTACYFSIIPGAGTLSLLTFGGIGKILAKRKHNNLR